MRKILFLPCVSPVGDFPGMLVSFKHFEHSLDKNQYQKQHQQLTDFKIKLSIFTVKLKTFMRCSNNLLLIIPP